MLPDTRADSSVVLCGAGSQLRVSYNFTKCQIPQKAKNTIISLRSAFEVPAVTILVAHISMEISHQGE